MPLSEVSKEIKLSIIRIIIAASIGMAIGYFIFSRQIEEHPLIKTEIKGTICLIIDDYGFIFNNMVED